MTFFIRISERKIFKMKSRSLEIAPKMQVLITHESIFIYYLIAKLILRLKVKIDSCVIKTFYMCFVDFSKNECVLEVHVFEGHS